MARSFTSLLLSLVVPAPLYVLPFPFLLTFAKKAVLSIPTPKMSQPNVGRLAHLHVTKDLYIDPSVSKRCARLLNRFNQPLAARSVVLREALHVADNTIQSKHLLFRSQFFKPVL